MVDGLSEFQFLSIVLGVHNSLYQIQNGMIRVIMKNICLGNLNMHPYITDYANVQWEINT